MKDALLAVLLLGAGVCVVVGVALISTAAGWIAAGALVAVWSILVLGEADG